ncbi:hypothetical protein TrispH2_005686 [Trichoplax sp. H2]|nr:hypothetical protein TrispH2_005686 [Trichoplax sp. H2]|eukprot:RDD41563.1 hypothetical protein TrispH2_005686 [Trichoplax sp. H2]
MLLKTVSTLLFYLLASTLHYGASVDTKDIVPLFTRHARMKRKSISTSAHINNLQKSYYEIDRIRQSKTPIKSQSRQDKDPKVDRQSMKGIEAPMPALLEPQDDTKPNTSSIIAIKSQEFALTNDLNFSQTELYNLSFATISSARNVTNQMPSEVALAIVATVSASLAILCLCLLPSVRYRINRCCMAFNLSKPPSRNHPTEIHPSAPPGSYRSQQRRQRRPWPSNGTGPTWLTGFSFTKMTTFVRFYTRRD